MSAPSFINVRRVRSIQPWFNGHHVVTMATKGVTQAD